MNLRALSLAVAGLLALVFLSQGLNAPFEKDEESRPASIIADILHRGDWILPADSYSEVTRKPPLYYWLSAALAKAAGGPMDEARARVVSLLAAAILAAVVMGCAAGLVRRRRRLAGLALCARQLRLLRPRRLRAHRHALYPVGIFRLLHALPGDRRQCVGKPLAGCWRDTGIGGPDQGAAGDRALRARNPDLPADGAAQSAGAGDAAGAMADPVGGGRGGQPSGICRRC